MKPPQLLVVAALLDSIGHIDALQYTNRRIFLLLHGSGTSAGAFPNSPTASGAKGFLSGVPRRPDHGAGLVPLNWQFKTLDAGSNDGSWWEGDTYKRLDASVAAVEAAIEAERGQISGIIGHEQGATVAAIVAARAALGECPVDLNLEFAVLCGAAMPTAQPYVDLLDRLRESGHPSIQTLHCLSKSDEASPLGKELAERFPSGEILWHDRGNAMPEKSWWKLTKAFPDRATGILRYVDQFSISKTLTPSTWRTGDD